MLLLLLCNIIHIVLYIERQQKRQLFIFKLIVLECEWAKQTTDMCINVHLFTIHTYIHLSIYMCVNWFGKGQRLCKVVSLFVCVCVWLYVDFCQKLYLGDMLSNQVKTNELYVQQTQKHFKLNAKMMLNIWILPFNVYGNVFECVCVFFTQTNSSTHVTTKSG